MKQQIKIEITIEAGDANVGCSIEADGEQVINMEGLEQTERVAIVNALASFAKLFSRCL